jgi:UDP-N-acetylmuramoyl-L-alanyl-D-glutamate--2,6-diaminopimelate ligase
VRLSEIADALEGATVAVPVGAVATDLASFDVTAIELDSRRARPGSLFCCLRGERADGHDHAPEAVAAGAVALLVERPLGLGVPELIVHDSRVAMAEASVAFYGDPAGSMTVIGVTGTNGKTTTTFLLREIFEEAGLHAEVLGTLSGARTTPEAPELQARLAAMRDRGTDAVAMEVSSHALDMHRVDGTRFAVVAFTNLSRDHLDYHGTMEAYFEVKARLFSPSFTQRAVVDLDSPYGRLLLDAAKVPTTGFSLDDVSDVEMDETGTQFTWRGHRVALSLAGRFNLSNALTAAESAFAAGIDPEPIANGLSHRVVVPGRFEVIDEGQPFGVIVDYAHTPDGLEQVLDAARRLRGGEVTVVFGCGGERDATKRPAMGEVAAGHADRVVLTADNSRGEDTGAIIDAVIQGYERAAEHPRHELIVEPDRRRAIATAFASAEPGDTVVIAGKGHETTQVTGDVTVPFDDREVARAELSRLSGGAR